MSLPLKGSAKLPQVITELNLIGERLQAAEAKITSAGNRDNQQDVAIEALAGALGEFKDIRVRITALEEKVAQLTPCSDQPEEPEDPPAEPPPDPPDPPPDPPAEPDLFLLTEPTTGLDFAAYALVAPAPQSVLLYKSGVGTLNAPTVVSTVDPDGIIKTTTITPVDADSWLLTVVMTAKIVGTYAATIVVNSSNQTNADVSVPIDFVVTAAPVPDPPDEPDLHLLAEPSDGLSFQSTEPAVPAQKLVLLYKSGTGTLQTPQVISSSDSSGIIQSAVITQVSTDSWHLTVGMVAKPPGNYTASITVRSANQTNASVTVPITYQVIAAPVVIPPAGGATTYRGANLPTGMTATAALAAGGRDTLSTAFGGSVWDTTDLIVGSSRYNAATVLTVVGTGAGGRTELLAHLATVAANDADYKIIVPVGTLSGFLADELPAKTNPNRHCWIVNTAIHAATFATPRGTKIPESTVGMCVLEGAAATPLDAILQYADAANARGYSFHGVVAQNDQASALADIQLGMLTCRRTTSQSALSAFPGRLYLDRCWIRGSDLTDNRRGINMNGPYLAVEDSRITGIHCVGNESAGIGGWVAAQFHKTINCTIKAGTQAILYGGADPWNPQSNVLDPADIYTERVYAFKPLSWLTTHPDYAGVHWTVKTGFEAKNVRRWLIDRCWTQNCWPDAQTGYAMLFQNLSDDNTNHLANRVRDVVIRNHRFDYVANGIDLLSRVAYNGGILPTNPMSKMVLDNILMTRVGGNRADALTIIKNGTTGYVGNPFVLLSDINGVTLDRITADANSDRAFRLEGDSALGSITNLVMQLGQYGAFRSGGATGSNALQAFFSAGLTMEGNVGYDLSEGDFATGWDDDETNASMLFQDYAGYDYRLTSAHLTKGVGGSRPGCDIDTLNTLLSGINT